MDRLTYEKLCEILKGVNRVRFILDGIGEEEYSSREVYEAVQELQHYKDLKVGDTVWVLYTERKTTEEKKVIGIDYEEKVDRLRFSDGTQFTIWDKKWDEYLGEFIFPAKEEVEAKLKELEVQNG